MCKIRDTTQRTKESRRHRVEGCGGRSDVITFLDDTSRLAAVRLKTFGPSHTVSAQLCIESQRCVVIMVHVPSSYRRSPPLIFRKRIPSSLPSRSSQQVERVLDPPTKNPKCLREEQV
jgi:hypothetical protein